MKITEISSVVLQPFAWVLVKVKTDQGITGIGEAYHGAGVHQIVTDHRMQRTLIGKDPLDIDKRWEELYVGTAMTGRRGAGVNAIGAIDMALWAIKGTGFQQGDIRDG